MLILSIRTDKPEAEIGLFKDQEKIDYLTWQAHLKLAETIDQKIVDLLKKNHLKMNELEAVVAYKGPGSFTGLRIGLSVANALAYGLNVPIVGASTEAWIKRGVASLLKGQSTKFVMPHYGAPVHITKPKH